MVLHLSDIDRREVEQRGYMYLKPCVTTHVDWTQMLETNIRMRVVLLLRQDCNCRLFLSCWSVSKPIESPFVNDIGKLNNISAAVRREAETNQYTRKYLMDRSK
jgi:hypothetical protein